MTLFNIYLCIVSFLIKPADTNIDSLFNEWNQVSLHSLKTELSLAKNADEKSLYENRLEVRPAYWNIESDSLNKESIRWKFLEQVQKDFNWKDNNWTVIEMMKSGEVRILKNHLICYDSSGAKIITYQWFYDKWRKIDEKHGVFKMKDLALSKARVPFNSGKYDYDIIVTNFKSEHILESIYFINTTLSDKGKIAYVING
jgi:hypothetical protein